MKNKTVIGNHNSNINIIQNITNNYIKLINAQKSAPPNTTGDEAAAIIIFSILIIGASSAYWEKLETFTNSLVIVSTFIVLLSLILLFLRLPVYKSLREIDGTSGPIIKYTIIITIQILNLLYLFSSVVKSDLWPFDRSIGFSLVTADYSVTANDKNPIINFIINSLESSQLLIEQQGIYALLPSFLYVLSLALCLAGTLTIDVYILGFILAGFLDKTPYSNATLGKLVNNSIKITIFKILRISLMTIITATLEIYLINATYEAIITNMGI